MIQLPHIWVPPRRPLILPGDPDFSVPKMEAATPAKIQSNTATGAVTVTLASGLTIGNVLIAVAARSDGAGQGAPTVIAGSGRNMTLIGSVQAHTNGSTCHLFYRPIVSGDSNVVLFGNPGGTWGIAAAEFSNIGALLGSAVTGATNTSGPTMGLTVSPGAGQFVIAAFCTRMDPVSWTANGSTANLGVFGGSSGGLYDGSEWGWGTGNATYGGTQTGSARNAGFPWNGIAQAFVVQVATPRAQMMGFIG